MKQRTKNIIARHVQDMVIISQNPAMWTAKRKEILQAIVKLQPDKPDDGTTNFIAFNVPNKDKRLKLKTGRFLSRKLSLNSGFLDDQTLQTLSDTINMELFGILDSDVKLINGRDITDAYRHSFGSGSCMCGGASEYTTLYQDNPERFQMLTMGFGNDQARAIVHKLDNGEYLMDRVYASSETIEDKMVEHAIHSNWMYRFGSSSVYFNGKQIDDYNVCVVSDLDFEEGHVPYMDTLDSGLIEHGKLAISHARSSYGCDYELSSTCGNLASGSECSNCGNTVHDDDMYYEDDACYCQNCHDELFAYCECCDSDVPQDDIVHIEDAEKWVCRDCAGCNYTECEDCNTWTENGYPIESDDKHVCESCLENYTMCEKCDEYFGNSNVQRIGDEYVCDDCKKEHFARCAECDEMFASDDMVENDDGGLVCDDCDPDKIIECAGQTELFDEVTS